MSVNALSGHGMIISRKKGGSGSFIAIAELGDVTPPELSRNEFDATTQAEDIDSYVLGVLRRSAVQFPMNFIPSNATHDHLTGLYNGIIDKTMDAWQFQHADSGFLMVCSGQVQKVTVKAPVDGKLSADVTVRMSGGFTINGVIVD